MVGDMKTRECVGGMEEEVFFFFLSSGNAVLLVEVVRQETCVTSS